MHLLRCALLGAWQSDAGWLAEADIPSQTVVSTHLPGQLSRGAPSPRSASALQDMSHEPGNRSSEAAAGFVASMAIELMANLRYSVIRGPHLQKAFDNSMRLSPSSNLCPELGSGDLFFLEVSMWEPQVGTKMTLKPPPTAYWWLGNGGLHPERGPLLANPAQ